MCYLRQTLLLAATLLFSTASWANCVKVTDNSFLSEAAIKAGYTARFWRGAFDDNIGHLGLPSVISVSANNKFQPSGTVLASIAASGSSASSLRIVGFRTIAQFIFPQAHLVMSCMRCLKSPPRINIFLTTELTKTPITSRAVISHSRGLAY